MNKIILLPMLVSFSFSAFAQEIDQLTRRNEKIEDSIELLDGEINARIFNALEKTNSKSKACNSTKSDERDAARKILFENLNHAFVFAPIMSSINGKVQEFANNMDPSKRRSVSFGESIYNGVENPDARIATSTRELTPIINVGGVQIGTDKIKNFFNDGNSFYLGKRKVETHAKKEKDVISELSGSDQNRHGEKSTIYKKYAAKIAKYEGFQFWERLCQSRGAGADASECSAKAYLQCGQNGKWQLNPKNKFTLKDYVTAAWDEGINCNTFSDKKATQMFENMNKVAFASKTAEVSQPNPLQPCPAEPMKCVDIIARYGQHSPMVNPVCAQVGSLKKTNHFIDRNIKFNYSKTFAEGLVNKKTKIASPEANSNATSKTKK